MRLSALHAHTSCSVIRNMHPNVNLILDILHHGCAVRAIRQVGIVGDSERSVENCDPITGQATDAVVTWKGKSEIKMTNGAIELEWRIPSDATAFAYSV